MRRGGCCVVGWGGAGRGGVGLGWGVAGVVRPTVHVLWILYFSCVLCNHVCVTLSLHSNLATWYILADCDAELPLAYLTAVQKEHHWPERDAAALTVLVSDCFLAADEDRLVSIVDENDARNTRVLTVAHKYMSWWSTVVWCRAQNLKGITPPTSLLLGERESRRMRAPEMARPLPCGTARCGAARSLASKWRRRFHGRIGVIRPREDLQPLVVHNKAMLARDRYVMFVHTL
jgi:hypothetical protein